MAKEKISVKLKREKLKVERTKKADKLYDSLSADDQRVKFKGTKTQARRGRKSRYS